MKIFVGTSGYSYKEWKGRFYPAKIQPKEMLRFYAERFDTVEINNTFYHMPTEDVLVDWAGHVPDGFVFAIKAPRVITHLKQLRNVSSEAEYLFRTVNILGGKRGPVLFQFPGSFRPNRETLAAFLGLVPRRMPCAFEFRNPSGIDAPTIELLRAGECGLCIADTDEKPADEIVRTAPWGYLRLRRGDYTDADLSRWLERIVAQKWERAYVFFKHEEDVRSPEIAMRFRALIPS